MKMFSQFPQATSLTNDDLLLISQWDGVSAYETKYVKANLAESVDKKEFIARIEQTGVTAPTLTVIKDDFNDTYTTVYNGLGDYAIQGFNSELTSDEEIYINTNNLQAGNFVRTTPQAVNEINIETFDNALNPADGILINPTYIRVTLYL